MKLIHFIICVIVIGYSTTLIRWMWGVWTNYTIDIFSLIFQFNTTNILRNGGCVIRKRRQLLPYMSFLAFILDNMLQIICRNTFCDLILQATFPTSKQHKGLSNLCDYMYRQEVMLSRPKRRSIIQSKFLSQTLPKHF